MLKFQKAETEIMHRPSAVLVLVLGACLGFGAWDLGFPIGSDGPAR
jgi:chemotaxis receptor (MCP) glutamine deamidase CheD